LGAGLDQAIAVFNQTDPDGPYCLQKP